MLINMKRVLGETLSVLDVVFRIGRGVDYRTLSHYILKINQYKGIDEILYEASTCLKDILNYDLFGFALKNEGAMDVWIDPRIHNATLMNCVKDDFMSQNVDLKIHYFEHKKTEISHNSDTIAVDNIISYQVMDGQYQANLYLLPKRKMLPYHYAIINIIVASIRNALEHALSMKQLEKVAAIDPLTNCYNRRTFSVCLDKDIAYARRYGKNLSLVMLDIDNFKSVNDTHGHQAGDLVLKDTCGLIKSMVRKSDYLARYGGEEFVLVLPETPLYNAVQLADKIRRKLAEHEIKLNGKAITITASFGVSSLENKVDGESMVQEADGRLYKAKALGKNNVVPSMLPCFADRLFVSPESERLSAVVA